MQQDIQVHQQRADRIEALLQEVTTFADPRARAMIEELIQALLDMYGDGLARVLELTEQAGAPGQALTEAFANDGLLASLFLLHGLHPVDIKTRIVRALDDVRPLLKSHGCEAEFVKIEDGVAYLRLQANGGKPSQPTTTPRQAVEEALNKAVPDLDALQIEDNSGLPEHLAVPMKFVPRRQKDKVR
jgi:Fe-S cluster biogenesis protein NfuA